MSSGESLAMAMACFAYARACNTGGKNDSLPFSIGVWVVGVFFLIAAIVEMTHE